LRRLIYVFGGWVVVWKSEGHVMVTWTLPAAPTTSTTPCLP
jgi:hypothetical protein